MKRVLHLIANLDVGGAEMDLIGKTLALKDRYHFEVTTLKNRGTLATRLEAHAVPVFAAGMQTPWDVAGCARLVRHVLARRPDIVHAHMHNAFWMSALLKLFQNNVPIVYTIQKEGTEVGSIERITGKFLMRRAAAVVAASKSVSESYRRMDLLPNGCDVIYNSIDFSRLSCGRNLLREEFGIETPWVIGTVGRLLSIKGHRHLLAALPEIKQAVGEVRCVVVGDGAERGALEAQARELGVAECLVWVGARADIQNFLPFFKVFVMPSVSEAFGIAAAEALALGVPVVASAVGGLPELIQEGITGYLVPVGDSRAIAARVIEVLTNAVLHDRLQVAARESMQRFSAEVLAERWAELYERVSARDVV